MGNLSPRLVVLVFKEPLSSIRKQVRRMVELADIIVTTPEMFTNRLDWLSASSFKSIQLCIMDRWICGLLTTMSIPMKVIKIPD